MVAGGWGYGRVLGGNQPGGKHGLSNCGLHRNGLHHCGYHQPLCEASDQGTRLPAARTRRSTHTNIRTHVSLTVFTTLHTQGMPILSVLIFAILAIVLQYAVIDEYLVPEVRHQQTRRLTRIGATHRMAACTPNHPPSVFADSQDLEGRRGAIHPRTGLIPRAPGALLNHTSAP